MPVFAKHTADDAVDDDANDELVASEMQRMDDQADDDADDELVASEIQRMERIEAESQAHEDKQDLASEAPVAEVEDKEENKEAPVKVTTLRI